MKGRSLFFIAFTVANLSLVAYGFLTLMMPDILLEPFSWHVFQFPAEATHATAYLEAVFRLLGFFEHHTGHARLVGDFVSRLVAA